VTNLFFTSDPSFDVNYKLINKINSDISMSVQMSTSSAVTITERMHTIISG